MRACPAHTGPASWMRMHYPIPANAKVAVTQPFGLFRADDRLLLVPVVHLHACSQVWGTPTASPYDCVDEGEGMAAH